MPASFDVYCGIRREARALISKLGEDAAAAASPVLRARLQAAADDLVDAEWREHDYWWDEDEFGEWNDDPCPPCLWSWWSTPSGGFPVGGWVAIDAGGAFGLSRFNFSDGTTGNFSTSGGLVRLSGGFDWMTGPLVTGIEGTISGANITGRNDNECCSVRNTWLGTFDGRLGYPIGNTLAYIKGGLAVGNVEQTIGDLSTTGTNVGWNVGAGLEWSFSKSWFLRLEYDHVDLGNVPCSPAVCGPDGNTKYEDNRFMIGVGGWVSPFNSYLSSDARLKSDIVTLGHLDNGLAVYRFRYAGSDQVYVGVMAQEVQMVRPDAVTRGEDGYLLVNYDRLGLRMETWEEWVAEQEGRSRPQAAGQTISAP